VFARLCVLLTVALFADSTLPNGIRISDIPASGDRFELVVGYLAGVRNETGGLSGLASIVSHMLASSAPVRALSLAAYGAGGDLQFVDELDRTAIRVSVPAWAKPVVLNELPALFQQSPGANADLIEHALRLPRPVSFRSKVEDEIRIGLLGSHPYHHPAAGWPGDVQQTSHDDIARFFTEHYGTDRAFVVTNSPADDDLRQKLSAVPERKSRRLAEAAPRVATAERTLRFAAEEDSGAVIFASPVPSVFYRGWYSVLMLDRLVRRAVPGKPSTSIVPAMDPYYWRMEVVVPAGQFAEAVQENVLQELNRLQFARARAEDLEAARRDALEYLNSRYAVEWFTSQGIASRRQEGIDWVQSFTADDMRIAARDLLIMNRVIATWSPKPKQNVVRVESINPAAAAPGAAPAADRPLTPVAVSPFPAHSHPAFAFAVPEKLSSGVWLLAGSAPLVYLAGQEASGLPDGNRHDGANGSLWRFTSAPDENTVRAFQKYRADRILVVAPPAMRDRARILWSNFTGSLRDPSTPTPLGNVSNIDLPALLILKAMLDRRLIESGWWQQATLRIEATSGATLVIEASPAIREQISAWIKEVAAGPVPDSDFLWAREAAIHHLAELMSDLQILAWQRVPDYVLADPSTIAATQVQDVAKLYF
jgi:hypothetical protein